MTWYMRNWYNVGAVLFAGLAFGMIFWGGALDRLTFILIARLMALFCHQFEEYRLPGGAPIIVNIPVIDERKLYDSYPGNTLSVVVVNTTVWLVYAAASPSHSDLARPGHRGVPPPAHRASTPSPTSTSTASQRPESTCRESPAWTPSSRSPSSYPYNGLKDRNTPYVLTHEELNRFGRLDKLKVRGVIRSGAALLGRCFRTWRGYAWLRGSVSKGLDSKAWLGSA